MSLVAAITFMLAALGIGLLWGDWVGSRSVARTEEFRRRISTAEWSADDPRWEIYQKLMDGELGPPIR